MSRFTAWARAAVLVALLSALAACGGGGTTTGTTGSTGSTGSTGTTGSTGPTNGKGCTEVALLLPESAAARWAAQDAPALTADIGGISGVRLSVSNAQGDAARQLTQAQAALAAGACILVVAPVDGVQAAGIVAAAKARSVPVIAYDRMIQSRDTGFAVRYDPQRVGVAQGQYIVDHFAAYTMASRRNCALISGDQADPSTVAVYRGVLRELQPLIDGAALRKVYDAFTPGGTASLATVEMEGVLTANQNDVQIAYAATDDLAAGVIAALRVQRLNGRVLVTGSGTALDGLRAVIGGDQTMTVYQPIALEARAAADLVKALHDGTDPLTLTGGATAATADGGAVPAISLVATAVDRTDLVAKLVTPGLVSLPALCQGLAPGAGGICP